MKQKIKRLTLKLLGLWPPKKDSAKRLIYDLKDAEDDYHGKHN